MKKNFLPISIDVSNQKVLIIGGGLSAFKKVKILQHFGVDVEVLAENVCSEIVESGVKIYKKTYQKKYLSGYLMLYSCTNNIELDKQILADGKLMGVLVNIHDNPDLCQFVSPAIFKKGSMTVAVGSNGENVYESIRLRDIISEFLTENHHIN